MKIGHAQYQKAAKKTSGKKKKKSDKKRARKKSGSQASPSEQVLRDALAVRPQAKRPPFPVSSLIFLCLALVASIWLFLMPDLVEHAWEKVEIGFFSQAGAETKTKAKTASDKEEKKENTAAAESQRKPDAVADIKNWTEEELSFFSKLNERKQELDLREAELAKLEDELQRQKVEIEKRIVELERIRNQIAGVLKERVESDEEKIQKLVQVYSNMKPQNAARVFQSINDDLAVEILARMKKKNAANILNLLDPDKAQMLSEKFTGYKNN